MNNKFLTFYSLLFVSSCGFATLVNAAGGTPTHAPPNMSPVTAINGSSSGMLASNPQVVSPKCFRVDFYPPAFNGGLPVSIAIQEDVPVYFDAGCSNRAPNTRSSSANTETFYFGPNPVQINVQITLKTGEKYSLVKTIPRVPRH